MHYSPENPLLTVPEACHELRAGHFVLLFDDQQPDTAIICLAAQFATAASVAFLKQHAAQTYAAVIGTRLDALHITFAYGNGALPQASSDRYLSSRLSIESSVLETTTILHALVHPMTRPSAILPSDYAYILRPHPGGVLLHRHYPESAVDLLRIAGLEPVAALGLLALDAQNLLLATLPSQWQLGLLSLDSILCYRKEHLLSLIADIQLPTEFSTFRLRHFQAIETGAAYLALSLGDLQHTQELLPLLRLHSACATGDLFGSQRCDCQAQLHTAMQKIAAEGRGLLLYLPQEGRGIGLAGKLQAYMLQEQGADTIAANEQLGYPVEARDYHCAIEILQQLGMTRARLMTNNPDKVHALQASGMTIERVALEIAPNPNNLNYLSTKQHHLGHALSLLTRQ